MKNLDIYLNFADLAVRSQRGKGTSRSVLTAKRSDLSAQSLRRALKEPDKMNKTVVRAKMGAVLSNMSINGCFCSSKVQK